MGLAGGYTRPIVAPPTLTSLTSTSVNPLLQLRLTKESIAVVWLPFSMRHRILIRS